MTATRTRPRNDAAARGPLTSLPALIGDVRAGFLLHLGLLWRRPLELVTVVTTPLLTLILASVVTDAGRAEVLAAVVVGSGLMGVWVLIIGESSEMISADRAWGTMPLLMSAPASLPAILTGRLLAATGIGVLTWIEAVLVGAMMGVTWHVPHPVVFAVGSLLTIAAVVASGALLAPLFLASRVGMLFEIVLVYPFYILGAVAFPISELPDWAQVLSNLVFLRWCLELVRYGLGASAGAAVAVNVVVLIALIAASALGAAALLRRTERRLRRLGSADHT